MLDLWAPGKLETGGGNVEGEGREHGEGLEYVILRAPPL